MKYLEKTKAIKLRKKGYSLNEIVDELGISKSSASTWVRNTTLSESAEKRLLTKIKAGQLYSQKVKRAQRNAKEDEAKRRARTLIDNTTFDQGNIMLMCALLYSCEGQKYPYVGISFMNSDPGLIALFLKLLRSSFKLDESRFRVQAHLHSYHDKDIQLAFWSKITDIPLSQFIKPYLKKSSGLYKKEGYQGCVNIRYHDVTISRELRAMSYEYMKPNN